MQPYSSIETLYKRDKATNKLNFNEVRQPEWEMIKGWMLTEKVDGTNIRVIVSEADIQIMGRSNNATVPPGIAAFILSTFPTHEEIVAYFGGLTDRTVTFYGEGYGPGIQGSDPMQYRTKEQGKAFRCFDILRSGTIDYWLSPEEWTGVCESLKIPTVTDFGCIANIPMGHEAALNMMDMFAGKSEVAIQDSGSVIVPEGVVARPLFPLFNQYGSRVIWKLTRREFK